MAPRGRETEGSLGVVSCACAYTGTRARVFFVLAEFQQLRVKSTLLA